MRTNTRNVLNDFRKFGVSPETLAKLEQEINSKPKIDEYVDTSLLRQQQFTKRMQGLDQTVEQRAREIASLNDSAEKLNTPFLYADYYYYYYYYYSVEDSVLS